MVSAALCLSGADIGPSIPPSDEEDKSAGSEDKASVAAHRILHKFLSGFVVS